MDDISKYAELTERLLANVEAQQETIRHVQSELSAQGAALCEMLTWLRRPDGGHEASPASAESAAAPAGASDRRGMPRRRGNPASVLISRADTGDSFQGVVADRSPDGLCLIVDQEVESGALLRVRPLHAPSDTTWFPVEVRSCRPELKIWIVGCRFTQRLTWSNLRLFG